MSGMSTVLARRGVGWRRWLLPCVVVFALQAVSPVAAWCLHDGTADAHLESALTHCDHADSEHRAVDLPPAATTAGQNGGAAGGACLAGVARVLPVDWLGDGAAGQVARIHIADARPPPLIERLCGHTTRLLI